jgi:hypothetical protein
VTLTDLPGNFHIASLRFFEDMNGLKIALYGHPSTYADGWIINLDIHDVFSRAPESVIVDYLYPIEKIPKDAEFDHSFVSCLTNTEDLLGPIQPTSSFVYANQATQPSKDIAFFPDIPMTGGQALSQIFYQVFGQTNCLKVWDPLFGADISPSQFSCVEPDILDRISAVVGHLSFSEFILNSHADKLASSGKVKIFATICDPIDRIISLYNYIRAHEYHPSHAIVAQLSLREFAFSEPANYQFHYLCRNESESIDSILERINTYTIQESRQGLKQFFFDHFHSLSPNIDMSSQSFAIQADKSSNIASIDDLDDEAIRQLRMTHNLDIQLYTASSKSGINP